MILHPELGLNPRLTICPICGGDGDEIALLGNANCKYVCNKCGATVYGTMSRRSAYETLGSKNNRCKCGEYNSLEKQELLPTEKIIGGPCKKCRELQEKIDQMIKEGGVYFKCKKCHSRGAIKANNPICQEVRRKSLEQGLIKNINDPVGLAVEECENCKGEQK